MGDDFIWPTYDQVCGVLYELAAGLFGGLEHSFPTFGVRDQGLLESAIALPLQTSFYPTFYDGLAAMTRSLAENHALVDGNKRLAVAVLHGTLLVNDYVFVWSDVDAATLIERCAKREIDYSTISIFIEAWSAHAGSAVRIPMDAAVIASTIAAQRKTVDGLVEQHAEAGRPNVLGIVSRHASGQMAEADWLLLASKIAQSRSV